MGKVRVFIVEECISIITKIHYAADV